MRGTKVEQMYGRHDFDRDALTHATIYLDLYFAYYRQFEQRFPK